MDEPKSDQESPSSAGDSSVERFRRPPGVRGGAGLRVVTHVLFAIALGGVGLFSWPMGLMLFGLGLSCLRPFPDVAQGFYSGLTIFGILGAPLGGLYWFTAGLILGPDGTAKHFSAPWRLAVAVYAVCLVAVVLFLGFFH